MLSENQPLDSHTVVYLIIWEMHRFSHQFPIAWKKVEKSIELEKPWDLFPGKAWEFGSGENPTKPIVCGELENLYSYFSHSMGAFFPLDSHPMVYFIICEMHGFPRQFPITWENAAKSIKLGEPGKLISIFFRRVWVLFFHQNHWYTLPHGKNMAFPINF